MIEQSTDVVATVRSYLDRHNVLNLATCVGGLVWASAVFYARNHRGLRFLSAPHTRHSQNLANNPQVAATIQQDCAQWEAIKGVQLEGVAMQVSKQNRTAVIEHYSMKFPVTGDQAPAAIVRALDKVNWYELHIQRLYFIDNSVSLGHRVEISPEDL